jgi:hypothetical protein
MIVALSISMSGCAAWRQHQARPSAAVLVERDCIVNVALTDKTECAGSDLDRLHCTGLMLTWKKGCEKVRIQR